MKLAIGSTRAGLTLKEDLKAHLLAAGHEVEDLGMQVDGPFLPYYEVAATIARAVAEGRFPAAIILCGTGAGSALVANKFQGVYAVQASSEFEARRAKTINNANVLCLGEWITPTKHALDIVEAWLGAEFTEGFEPDWQDFLRGAFRAVQDLEAESFR